MEDFARKTMNRELTVPFVVTLLSVLIVIAGIFLPYMSATGEMAKYIENYPNGIASEEYNLTNSDMEDIAVISISKVAASAYSKEEGIIFDVIVWTFSLLLALTALFVIIKKPIAVIIFDLMTCGVFAVLNLATSKDFIGADKYAWGFAHHAMMIALVAVLAGAIWMFVKKIIVKRDLKANS